jgi:hypothetical protein
VERAGASSEERFSASSLPAERRLVCLSTTRPERSHGASVLSASMKFEAGTLYITPGAKAVLLDADVMTALARHLAGDWGELDQHDWQENELSLKRGFRLLSAYQSSEGVKFWIITEADRSMTTILLPEEY